MPGSGTLSETGKGRAEVPPGLAHLHGFHRRLWSDTLDGLPGDLVHDSSDERWLHLRAAPLRHRAPRSGAGV